MTSVISNWLRRGMLAGSVITTACTRVASVPPDGIPDLYAAASGPISHVDADGCARVHDVWKAEVRAVHETASLGWSDRADALIAQAYESFEGKVGYFLGLRITQAYVARHGRESWTDLYDLDATEILERSGYGI